MKSKRDAESLKKKLPTERPQFFKLVILNYKKQQNEIGLKMIRNFPN